MSQNGQRDLNRRSAQVQLRLISQSLLHKHPAQIPTNNLGRLSQQVLDPRTRPLRHIVKPLAVEPDNELILTADKEGTNQAFFEAFNDMIEVRNPDVDLKKVRNQSGARIINTEFKSALGAISEHPWIKEGKLRIKSMRLVNEGDQSQCADASKYLFELGYYALPTEKYVMVFVKSDVTKGSDGKRVINKIRTSIQENLNDVPVCP
jgi:hypothetical protein